MAEFTVTECIDGPYMESLPDFKFVKDIEGVDETPRKDDKLIINGDKFRVSSVERNYDTGITYIYVIRKQRPIIPDFPKF
jgi:hypothetical protein